MTFDWHTEYARALNLYGGDTPSATLEQNLLDAFTEHPQAVTNAITKIGKAYASGKIHSPWGALKAEIPKQISSHTRIGDGHERNHNTANAEQWLKNAGLHYDRWPEIQDELFGERGHLHPWRTDTKLVDRIHHLWTELRPAGEQTEHDELERAETWKTNRDTIIAQPTKTLDNTQLRALALAKSHPTTHPEPINPHPETTTAP